MSEDAVLPPTHRWPARRREGAPRRAHLGFAILFAAYAAFVLLSLPRYGPTWDVFNEFPRATAYVSHVLGQETPSGKSPWHRVSYEQARSHHGGSANGCLPSLIAAATGKVLWEKLRWLGYIDAYHSGLALLWLLFVAHFYFRLTELHGPRLALVATVLLALTPRIVAHVPNNMKDVPALAFATAAMLELAVALTRRRPRRIFAAALFAACAMASKFVAAIVVLPAALLVALALRHGGLAPDLRRRCALMLLSVPLLTAVLFVAHWPYLWAPPSVIWERLVMLAEPIGRRTGSGPSLYPLMMAVITTPILTLAGLFCAAVAALLKPAEERRERVLLAVYAFWMLAVLGVFSSGKIVLFDGIRHFLLFLPPAAVLSAWGLLRASDTILARIAGRGGGRRWPAALALAMIVLASLAPIALYHPYEIAYFNGLVGGLPGATRFSFGRAFRAYEPGDYWGTSVRACVEWSALHLPAGAAVWISVPDVFAPRRLFRLRRGLAYVRPADRQEGRPHYLIFAYRRGWFGREEKVALRGGEVVHREVVREVPLSFVVRLPEEEPEAK